MLMIEFVHLVVTSDDLKQIYSETYNWTLQSLPRIGEIVIISAKGKPDLKTKVKHVMHMFEADHAIGGKIIIAVTPLTGTDPLPKGFPVR